ncbi:MAG: hypothetical protein D6698_06810 [Gammaproteobacteria bacterium]|nr:MAG: hypothetical protein D6698_06810 [Gammaproteobacteria bacterium]
MYTDEVEKIRELMSKGYGYRRIAKALGLSQYRVRSIIRSLVIDKLNLKAPKQKRGTKLKLKKVSKKRVTHKVAVVLSDIHIPYHCPSALAIAMDYTESLKPDRIVLNGDIVDMYSVSRYMKDPLRIDTFQEELDQARDFLRLLRQQNPKAKITFIKGNHEARIEKFLIDRAPELSSLRCLSLDSLLGLSEFDIDFIDQGIKLGNLYVEHGAVARSSPGASALAYYRKMGTSVLVGHIHKLNVIRHRNVYGVHTLVENACLCDQSFDWLHTPVNWQQGFTEVHYQSNGNFQIFQHCIVDGKLVSGDMEYKACR